MDLPTDNLGIVGVPGDQFISDYALAHPNVTQFGALVPFFLYKSNP